MEEKEKFKGHPIAFPAKVEIIGIVVAAIPMFANFSSTYSENGRVVSFVDYVAIVCGVLAMVIGATNYRLLKHTTDDDLLKRRVAFQLIRGSGIFYSML